MFQQLLKATSQGLRGPGYGNIHETERMASLVLGVGCVGLAFTRGRLLRRGTLAGLGGALIWRGVTGHCHLYKRLGVNTARPDNVKRAGSDQVSSMPHRQGVNVKAAVEIDRSPHDVYEFWKTLENLPQFMEHLESVQNTGVGRSHWVARAPLGHTVEWDAQIIAEDKDHRISWRSLDGSDIANAGTVTFEPMSTPRGGGTRVKVHLKYNPPAGRIGAAVANLLGEEPSRQLQDDLARLKDVLEGPLEPPQRPEPGTPTLTF